MTYLTQIRRWQALRITIIKYVELFNLLADCIICLCRSWTGISAELRRFHKGLQLHAVRFNFSDYWSFEVVKPTYRKLDNISKLYVKQASPFTVWQSLRPRLCDQWTNHMPCTIRIWAYAVCLDIMGHVKVWPMNERNAHSKKKIRLFLFLLQLLGSNRDWHSCLGKTVINSLIITAKKKKNHPQPAMYLVDKTFSPSK